MRKLTVLLASVLFAAGLASQSGAATLTIDTTHSGTLALTLGALPAIALPGIRYPHRNTALLRGRDAESHAGEHAPRASLRRTDRPGPATNGTAGLHG